MILYHITKESMLRLYDSEFRTFRASYDPYRARMNALFRVRVKKDKKLFSTKRTAETAASTEQKSFVFVGFPDKDQQTFFRKTIGCCRFLWNRMLSDTKQMISSGKTVTFRTPASYKKEPGLSWLAEPDATALCSVQQNFERAYNEYLSGDKGMPRFKKKGLARNSFTSYLSSRKRPDLYLSGNMLFLPKMKTGVSIRMHRPVPEGGLLKHCTVSLEPNGTWLFALVFEYGRGPEKERTSIEKFASTKDISSIRHTGLDMSVPELYYDANGNTPSYTLNGDVVVSFTKQYRSLEKKIAREQRRLSRMTKGSSNYEKQCRRIASLYAKTKHRREDFLHQISARLVRDYDVITIEDLNIAAMKKSLNLGKSLSDNGWGEFVRMLHYKAERNGSLIITVDKFFPSSKTCSVCGHVHKTLSLNDREYICPECGNVMHRDVQAAVNLDMEGLRILFCILGGKNPYPDKKFSLPKFS